MTQPDNRKLWLNADGKILVNAQGVPYYSEECCCKGGGGSCCYQRWVTTCVDENDEPVYGGQVEGEANGVHWRDPELDGHYCDKCAAPPEGYAPPEGVEYGQWYAGADGTASCVQRFGGAYCTTDPDTGMNLCHNQIDPPAPPTAGQVGIWCRCDLLGGAQQIELPSYSYEITFIVLDGYMYDYGPDHQTVTGSHAVSKVLLPAQDRTELGTLSCDKTTATLCRRWARRYVGNLSEGDGRTVRENEYSAGGFTYVRGYRGYTETPLSGGAPTLQHVPEGSPTDMEPGAYVLSETDAPNAPHDTWTDGQRLYGVELGTSQGAPQYASAHYFTVLDPSTQDPVAVTQLTPSYPPLVPVVLGGADGTQQFAEDEWGTVEGMRTDAYSEVTLKWTRIDKGGACLMQDCHTTSGSIAPGDSVSLPGCPLWEYTLTIGTDADPDEWSARQVLCALEDCGGFSGREESWCRPLFHVDFRAEFCRRHWFMYIMEDRGCPDKDHDPTGPAIPFGDNEHGQVAIGGECEPVAVVSACVSFDTSAPGDVILPNNAWGAYPDLHPSSTIWLHEDDETVNQESGLVGVDASGRIMMRAFATQTDAHAYKILKLDISNYPSWYRSPTLCSTVLDPSRPEVPTIDFTHAWHRYFYSGCTSAQCPQAWYPTDTRRAAEFAFQGSYKGTWHGVDPVDNIIDAGRMNGGAGCYAVDRIRWLPFSPAYQECGGLPVPPYPTPAPPEGADCQGPVCMHMDSLYADSSVSGCPSCHVGIARYESYVVTTSCLATGSECGSREERFYAYNVHADVAELDWVGSVCDSDICPGTYSGSRCVEVWPCFSGHAREGSEGPWRPQPAPVSSVDEFYKYVSSPVLMGILAYQWANHSCVDDGWCDEPEDYVVEYAVSKLFGKCVSVGSSAEQPWSMNARTEYRIRQRLSVVSSCTATVTCSVYVGDDPDTQEPLFEYHVYDAVLSGGSVFEAELHSVCSGSASLGEAYSRTGRVVSTWTSSYTMFQEVGPCFASASMSWWAENGTHEDACEIEYGAWYGIMSRGEAGGCCPCYYLVPIDACDDTGGYICSEGTETSSPADSVTHGYSSRLNSLHLVSNDDLATESSDVREETPRTQCDGEYRRWPNPPQCSYAHWKGPDNHNPNDTPNPPCELCELEVLPEHDQGVWLTTSITCESPQRPGSVTVCGETYASVSGSSTRYEQLRVLYFAGHDWPLDSPAQMEITSTWSWYLSSNVANSTYGAPARPLADECRLDGGGQARRRAEIPDIDED